MRIVFLYILSYRDTLNEIAALYEYSHTTVSKRDALYMRMCLYVAPSDREIRANSYRKIPLCSQLWRYLLTSILRFPDTRSYWDALSAFCVLINWDNSSHIRFDLDCRAFQTGIISRWYKITRTIQLYMISHQHSMHSGAILCGSFKKNCS